MNVTRKTLAELDLATYRSCLELWERVWPNKDGRSMESILHGAEASFASRLEADPENRKRLAFHYIAEGDRVLAVSRSYEHTIRFVATGETRLVQALASVCSHPECRGRGLGKWVVQDAFARVGAGREFEFSLFQTPVPAFYEKLGAVTIANPFLGTSREGKHGVNPWWEEHVMRYPTGPGWGEGLIDLGGPGY